MKTEEMKSKLDAFFATATQQDVGDLLERTNFDFYKNVKRPEFEELFPEDQRRILNPTENEPEVD